MRVARVAAAMKKLLAVAKDALIGALLFGVVVGIYAFCFAGPAYYESSTDVSARGLWPIVSFGMTVVAAAVGAVVGAIVAAIRIVRRRSRGA